MELVTLNEIFEVCIEQTGFTREQLLGNSRARCIVLTRQVFCYVAKRIGGYQVVEIGRFLGKDHTTVIHSVKKMHHYFFTEDTLAMNYFERISEMLNRKYYNNRLKVTIPVNLDIQEMRQRIIDLGCIVE